MELCDDGHDEVCYEGRTCPACRAAHYLQKDIQQLEKRVEDLLDEIERLKDEHEEAMTR